MRPLLYVWTWVRAGFIVARYHWPTTAVIAAGAAGFVLSATSAKSQAVYTGTPAVMDGPMTVNGFVTMTSGLSVDGGVRTTDLRADTATAGSLDAGVAWVGDLNVTGRATLKNLDVMGPTSFNPRPSGIFLPGTLTRPGGLSLGIGCSTLGVIPVPGALVKDSCDVATLPTAALNLGVVFDCFVTAANTVTVRSCGLVALVAAPAGEYNVVVSGPVP